MNIEAPDFHVVYLTISGKESMLVRDDSIAGVLTLAEQLLKEWTCQELKEIDSACIEELTKEFDRWRWVPRKEISLRRIRLRAAAKEQHAKRQEQS